MSLEINLLEALWEDRMKPVCCLHLEGPWGALRRLQPYTLAAHMQVPVMNNTPAQEHDPGGLKPVPDVLDITVLGGSGQARRLGNISLARAAGVTA